MRMIIDPFSLLDQYTFKGYCQWFGETFGSSNAVGDVGGLPTIEQLKAHIEHDLS